MRTIMIFCLTVLYVAVVSSFTSIAEDKTSEEYVYAFKIEGGKVYRVVRQTGSDKEETLKKEIRRMEIIPSGANIEIERGASVSLTSTGCGIVNLAHKDSPYSVNMNDFNREASVMSKAAKYFKKALKEFIYPDSRLGARRFMKVRSFDTKCMNTWPVDNSYILPIGEFINLGWRSEETRFLIKINELNNQDIIYSGKTSSDKIAISKEKFKHGRTYTWSLTEEDTGKTCTADFTLLSKDESEEILNTLNEITSLLPFETDNETRCRLQAGYLRSEALEYSAWQWLELKKIIQELPVDAL